MFARKIIAVTASLILLSCARSSENGSAKEKASSLSAEANAKTEIVGLPSGEKPAFKKYRVKVVKTFPNDPKTYVQGFKIENGIAWISSGLYGKSYVEKRDLASGEVLIRKNFPSEYFAEGADFFGDKLYVLTWREGTCFVLDKNSLDFIGEFDYKGEGWGLANANGLAAETDGSDVIKFFDPKDWTEKRRIYVRKNGVPEFYLNEMEYIDGKIWANVYEKDIIDVINPLDGRVEAEIDLRPLRKYLSDSDAPDVLNGIARDPASRRIYLTGKYWKYIFEVKLEELK